MTAIQDFHLAKRHYDLAYITNSEAYLPVLLSLVKLHIRSIWHTLMGGQNGLTIWDDDEESSTLPSPVPQFERLTDIITRRSVIILRQPGD